MYNNKPILVRRKVLIKSSDILHRGEINCPTSVGTAKLHLYRHLSSKQHNDVRVIELNARNRIPRFAYHFRFSTSEDPRSNPLFVSTYT